MIFISVTRLRLRSLRFLPEFFVRTIGSTRQIERTPGFITGCLATEGVSVFWTITAWREDAAMLYYRNSGDHKRAMPKLLGWCDEASIVHWLQEDAVLPTLAEAVQRTAEQGRLSKVRHPSARHLAVRDALRHLTPRAGPSLQPKYVT